MPSERSERRGSLRHRVTLPVALDDGQGSTRDVSASGVFVTLTDRSTRAPQPREPIRFPLILEHADPHGPLPIDCEGDVVRIEIGPEAIGVAVRISAYDFDADGVPLTF